MVCREFLKKNTIFENLSFKDISKALLSILIKISAKMFSHFIKMIQSSSFQFIESKILLSFSKSEICFKKIQSLLNLMKGYIFLLAMIATSLAVVIEENRSPALFKSKAGLQFSNYSGPGVRQEHITSFINYANSASAFYKNDIKANAKYIKEKMDVEFGDIEDETAFFVVIQTDDAPTGWFLWMTSDALIAQLQGINKVNPSWSYLFQKFYAPSDSDTGYVLIKEGTKGEGIGTGTEKLINDSVNTYQTGQACRCVSDDTANIGSSLIQAQQKTWSAICAASPNINAYVYTIEGLWIHTKPKNYYYTLFVSI